jgi:hypothetical protein
MHVKLQNMSIMLCASLLLTACTTAHKSSVIPEQGLTISELYQQSQARPLNKLPHRAIHFAYKKDDFKALPNPEVPIYVFAHVAQLGDEQIIKPAFTTRFFLYKQNQYALASELY